MFDYEIDLEYTGDVCEASHVEMAIKQFFDIRIVGNSQDLGMRDEEAPK